MASNEFCGLSAVAAETIDSLRATDSYCTLDHFMDRMTKRDAESLNEGAPSRQMLEEMIGLLQNEENTESSGDGDALSRGNYRAGELAGDEGFWQTKYDPSKRSDFVKWITEKELQSGSFPALLKYFEAARALGAACAAQQTEEDGLPLGTDHQNVPELTCDRMMLAVYPLTTPSRFQAHIDNPNNNGRVLTFTYYLNFGWDAERDGGCLQIFPESARQGLTVVPEADKLCIFFADKRTPHEVQPTTPNDYREEAYRDTNDPRHLFRFSIALWFSYVSPQEKADAFKGAFASWIASIKARKAAEAAAKSDASATAEA